MKNTYHFRLLFLGLHGVTLNQYLSVYQAKYVTHPSIFTILHMLITAHIQKMGKVLFSQVCVCSHGKRGASQSSPTPRVSMSFPEGISVTGPRSLPGGGWALQA